MHCAAKGSAILYRALSLLHIINHTGIQLCTVLRLCRSIVFICLVFLCLLSLFIWPQIALGKLQVPYEVRWQGIEDKNLKKELQKVSDTVQLIDKPPATPYLLQKRARDDLSGMLEILKANAYYQASIKVDLEHQDEDKKYTVVFQIRPGPRYTLQNLRIIAQAPKPVDIPEFPEASQLGLEIGGPALAQNMRSAKRDLLNIMEAKGYVFARVSKQQAVVRHKQQAVVLKIYLSPGPRARFGKLKIQGLERVEENFIRQKIPWEIGQIYDPDLVEEFQASLRKTKLFALVRVDHAQALNEQGRLPMTLDLRERLPRSVSAGLGYDTDSGIRASLGWEHKNIWGKGETLSFDTKVSALEQEVEGVLRKPSLWHPDLSVLGKGSYSREDTDAYQQRAAKGSLDLEYELNDNLTLGSGVSLKRTQVEDLETEQTFNLVSIPSNINWDTRDDLLDPKKGEIINWQSTIFQEIFTGELSFLKNTLYVRWFHNFTALPDLTLALRGKLGSIWGADTHSIPADERYYAGGGGSIRGYPYQSVGPLKNNDPLGGRSLLEISTELRWKWTKSWGTVFFLDAGNSYESMLPEMDQKLFWGLGLGLRYYTGFGPLRLDVAFPLDKRENIDDSVQFYISIGQAF